MMQFHYEPALWWLVLCGGLPLLLAVHLLRGRRPLAARLWAIVLWTQVAWTVGHTLELSSVGLGPKVWLDALQWYPVCLMGMAMVAFAHAYTATPRPGWVLWAYGLSTLPAATFFASTPWHGRARAHAALIPGDPFDTLTYPFEPLDDLLVVATMTAAAHALVLLLRHLGRMHRAHLLGGVILAASVALPTFGNLLTSALGVRVFGQRDLSFVYFFASALLVAYGMRRELFSVLPMARDVVFDQVPDAAIVIDRRGLVVDMNRAAGALFGVREADAIGRPATLLAPESSAWCRTLLGGSAPLLAAPRADDGRLFEARVEPIDDFHHRVILLHDVTARARVEALLKEDEVRLRREVDARSRALEESERKFRAIFEQTFQFIGMLSPEGVVLEANGAALSLIEAARDEVVGRPFWETGWWRHSEEMRDRLRGGIARAAEGEFVRFEATHPDAEGRVHFIDFSLTPVRGADGGVVWIIPEGRDVTDLHEARQQLQQAQKMEALGRLAGGVAHDFNNLLTVIAGSAALLRDPQGDGTELLDQIERATQTASDLTRQLLAFSRKGVVQSRAVDVGSAIQQHTSMIQRVLPPTIAVEVALSSALSAAQFDDSQLQQVLLNLSINARDAMPDGGTLWFRAEMVRARHPDRPGPEQDWVCVTVRDSGHGMSEDQVRRVFEPFFTTKGLGKGTGLGLAMVYGALGQHGGFIQVDSRPGAGTTFELFLRVAAGVRHEREAVSEPPTSEVGIRRPTVVVVEDEASVRGIVSLMLERAQMNVKTYSDPRALLAEVESLGTPALLISDLAMPGMSGIDMVKRLSPIWPDVPVLYLSGYTDDDRLSQITRQGGAFLSKPFKPQDLIDAVWVALDDEYPRLQAIANAL